ncbi:centromere protein X isoform X1 [Carlito syrichta]|uniref:Centromere protein X n=1 Tax=Carlito syrichta TaxID=1868482 RepID=A0A1U7SJR2_CARSF|nr:centromere protein X isoform X1 [Carlito syrichta]
MEGAGAGFRKELVSKLLHLHFKDDKTKVSSDALQLMVELLKIFVVGRSSYPWGPAGPGRGCDSGRCGSAGEGASSAAPGLLGVSILDEATPGRPVA